MADRVDKRGRLVLELVVAMLWIGLLLGVSFLATPAKFLAPSLSLAVALDVGRQTFGVFNKVEWALAILLLALVVSGPRAWLSLAVAVVVAAMVVVETIWLLPVLDQRVGLIITGQQPPESSLHVVYIALQIVKLAVLCVLAAAAARRLAR
ncbi:hypothetical protein [Mesorhizobium sp. A556]